MFQRKRVYQLTLGNTATGDGVLIDNLQIKFNVSRSADNKKKPSSATVDIYNLSKSTLNRLSTPFTTCTLKVGYEDQGLVTILTGNVKDLETTQAGTDRITRLQLGEAYATLNHQKVRAMVAPGQTVEDAIEYIRKFMPDIGRGAYLGPTLRAPLPYGRPLTGSPRELLTKLCEEKGLEWRVDGNALFVTGVGSISDRDTGSAPLISKETGMIGVPYRSNPPATKLPKDKKSLPGVKFTALLNPSIVPGKLVKIISDGIKGWYRVNDIVSYGDYRGTDWYVECFCSVILEDEAIDLPPVTS